MPKLNFEQPLLQSSVVLLSIFEETKIKKFFQFNSLEQHLFEIDFFVTL